MANCVVFLSKVLHSQCTPLQLGVENGVPCIVWSFPFLLVENAAINPSPPSNAVFCRQLTLPPRAIYLVLPFAGWTIHISPARDAVQHRTLPAAYAGQRYSIWSVQSVSFEIQTYTEEPQSVFVLTVISIVTQYSTNGVEHCMTCRNASDSCTRTLTHLHRPGWDMWP